MTAGSLRLFLAVSVPGPQLDWVSERVGELRARWPEARWIPPENQHVTLKFLGSTDPAQLGYVVAAGEAVAAGRGAASLTLRDLGVFPSARRARVLWVGFEDPQGLLACLARDLDDRLAGLGFEPEKRPYSPHLTIARFKRPTAIGELPPLAGVPKPFDLRRFALWRSRLSPKGATYERLFSFSLGSGDCAQ